jgi:hypothetical protein
MLLMLFSPCNAAGAAVFATVTAVAAAAVFATVAAVAAAAYSSSSCSSSSDFSSFLKRFSLYFPVFFFFFEERCVQRALGLEGLVALRKGRTMHIIILI